ncbi:MAG: hypothetical protein IV100_04015 [Myxococcales bacterium]|nr:hypothetical protein [Myxococcales bacterium]
MGLAGIGAAGYFGMRKYRANKEFREYQRAQAKTAQALNPQQGAMMNMGAFAAEPAMPMSPGFEGIDRASWMDATTAMPVHGYATGGDVMMPRTSMIAANTNEQSYDAVW